jgi:hypothetical protein
MMYGNTLFKHMQMFFGGGGPGGVECKNSNTVTTHKFSVLCSLMAITNESVKIST